MGGDVRARQVLPARRVAATTCLDIEEITEILAKDRDPARLREVWEGWHTISPPMKKSYARFVELSNKGARELGFADTGAMWRSRYDMAPDDFAKELDRLWEQLRPLYLVAAHARAGAGCTRGTAMRCPRTARCRRTCSATSGRRTGRNVYDIVGPAATRQPRSRSPTSCERGR